MEKMKEKGFWNRAEGIWHYIKVFCCFFSLIASFAFFTGIASSRLKFEGLLIAMWVLGIVAALLVAPGKFLKFGWKILSACAVFGWFLLPFPFDLITVLFSVAGGIFAAFLAVVAIPAIFTIYTYIKDVRYGCNDRKKELIVIASAVGAVILSIGLFFGLNGIAKAVEKPILERKFMPAAIYQNYVMEEDSAKVYPEDLLNNPVSSEALDQGYIRENSYVFEQQEGTVCFQYNLCISFEYINGEWEVTNTYETKEAVGFTDINGSWMGEGRYLGNTANKNRYTGTLDFSEAGGTGSIDVFLEGKTKDHMEGTVTVEEFAYDKEENSTTVKLTLHLKEPMTYAKEESISQISCVYCFETNTLLIENLSSRKIELKESKHE